MALLCLEEVLYSLLLVIDNLVPLRSCQRFVGLAVVDLPLLSDLNSQVAEMSIEVAHKHILAWRNAPGTAVGRDDNIKYISCG